jgi:hypothetical protein
VTNCAYHVRKDTRNMICMHCSTAQNAAQYCQNCHIRLARYYCDKVCLFIMFLTLVSSVGRFADKVYIPLQ